LAQPETGLFKGPVFFVPDQNAQAKKNPPSWRVESISGGDMEETVPIIHSPLMRRNRNLSGNPYGVKLWYLRVTFAAFGRNDRQ
jgi:hypothetical protein